MSRLSQFQLSILLVVALLAVCAQAFALGSVSARKEEEKPDIFMGWMNNPALAQFKPLFSQMQQTMGPMSQQMSAQILDNVPGAKEVFKAMTQMQEQFGEMLSQFNPAQQLLGSLQGGSGGGSNQQQGSSGSSGSSSSANNSGGPKKDN